jgi:hypothetical protein
VSVGSGRISLLIDSPLRTLAQAFRVIDKDVRKEINTHTKREALPLWHDSVRAHAQTSLEFAVLVKTAKVGVTAQNVFLRAGGAGKTKSGTAVSVLQNATEYGANPDTEIKSKTKKGKPYTRRRGDQFRAPRRAGYVVGPAAREAIPRIADLWIQTAIRTIHESIQKATR